MPIEIKITTDTSPGAAPVADQITEAMAALGYARAVTLREVAEAAYNAGIKVDFNLDPKDENADVPVRGVESVKNDAGPSATRERGQPSPGKARRTKAEIAEDEAADKAQGGYTQEMTEEFTAAQAAISTGEERVGPEDDEATVEQDEADETAETEAAIEERPADKKLTHDDVRNALGAYVKQYGMAAAQADGPKVISLVCGEGKVKMSDIPDDQALLAKVVAGIDEMLTKNPFKRDKVA